MSSAWIKFLNLVQNFWSLSSVIVRRVLQTLKTLVVSLIVAPPEHFSQKFSESYGLRGPKFFDGNLTQAIHEAKRRRCLLAVYIHCETSQLVDEFCQNILSNEVVCSFLNDEKKYVTWGGNRSKNLLQIFKPRTFPHLSVVLPDRVEQCVGLVEGKTSVEETASVLLGCTHSLDDMLGDEAAMMLSDREIREQQDREYEESLRQDAIREQQLKEKGDLDRQLQEDAKAAEHERLRRFDERRLRRVALANEIRKELTHPLPDPSRTTKICVRLPAGERIERPFSYDDKLSSVCRWVEASEYLYPDKVEEGGIPPHFQLSTPLSPPYDTSKKSQTLEHLNLIPNALLLLRPVDEDNHMPTL